MTLFLRPFQIFCMVSSKSLKKKLKRASSMECSTMQDIADLQTELVYLSGVARNVPTFTNLQFLFISERDRHC